MHALNPTHNFVRLRFPLYANTKPDNLSRFGNALTAVIVKNKFSKYLSVSSGLGVL